MRLKYCMCVGYLGDRVLFTAKTSSVEKLPIDDHSEDHSEEVQQNSLRVGFLFQKCFSQKLCLVVGGSVERHCRGKRGRLAWPYSGENGIGVSCLINIDTPMKNDKNIALLGLFHPSFLPPSFLIRRWIRCAPTS